MVIPMDQRLYDQNENFNQKNSNKLYQPNVQLLQEIEHAQKVREYQRTQRENEESQPVSREVEEISPNGTRRQFQSGSPSKSALASESRAMNPFAEDGSYLGGIGGEQPRTMFSVKMNGQPSELPSMEAVIAGPTEANCRQDLPNRPEYAHEL